MNNKKWYIKKMGLAITVYVMSVHKLTDDLEVAKSFDSERDIRIYLTDNKMSLCTCENKPVEL